MSYCKQLNEECPHAIDSVLVQAVILAYESGLVVPGADARDGVTRK
jgi:hypothetical protein